jgi:hypothetical protein
MGPIRITPPAPTFFKPEGEATVMSSIPIKIIVNATKNSHIAIGKGKPAA